MYDRDSVTGGAGFIGSHLTKRLLALGHEVVGFHNLSSGDSRNLVHTMSNPRFRFVEEGLPDSESARQALEAWSLVFHLAADPKARTEQPRLE